MTLITSTVFWSVDRPRELAIVRSLDALVFVTVLYPLISRFGLPGVAWAGVIAYAFACVNRAIALNKVIPGISPKWLRKMLGMLVLLTTLLLVRALVSR